MEELANTQTSSLSDRVTYKDSTYEIISKVAYLIGVPKRIFENEVEPPKLEIYEKLERDKSARIIRNLCVLRTSIERYFKKINDAIRYDGKTIFSLPDYVPGDSLKQLSDDGIAITRKANVQLQGYVVEINRLISDRINNCKGLFPMWLEWDYIRELFIMPDGLNEAGTAAAAALYYDNKMFYPYQMYINWRPKDEGNILYNDRKFVELLYAWHFREFKELSRVSDAGSFFKNSIYDFIDGSRQVVAVVDCENVDPYSFCATLRGLDEERMDKISSIILFDDIHTSSGWDLLQQFTNIPIEHIEIERVKENKSLVDMKLALRVSHEIYKNNVDSFILASSDSDFWALISSFSETRFVVMVEHGKCGPDLKNALAEHDIFYCYMDDFYSGDAETLKQESLFREMSTYLKQSIQLNLNEMLDKALSVTRISMSASERQQFYNKHLKPLQMNIAEDGEVTLSLKIK